MFTDAFLIGFVCDFQADIINVHEYKNWRNTGVAFEVREADYDVPNKTVASGLILRQVRKYIILEDFKWCLQ